MIGEGEDDGRDDEGAGYCKAKRKRTRGGEAGREGGRERQFGMLRMRGIVIDVIE